MHPADAVDGYGPPWSSFASFFTARSDDAATYLIELNHELDTRREWTVGEWKLLVARAVGALRERGVAPGDSVAALLGNRSEALVVAYACWTVGACYVPLNAHDSVARQRFIVQDSGARLLVCAETEDAAVLTEGTNATALAAAAVIEAEGRTSGPRKDDSEPVGLDVEALRIYTSGTVGEPKGVVLSARNLLIDCDALASATGWDSATRALVVLPIHHVNGLLISSLLPWFVSGSTVLCDRFRSDHFWDDAERESVNVCSVVPSLLEFLLRSRGGPHGDFREFLCGAGPLLPETVLAFESRYSRPVRHLFGMSETTAVVTLMPRMGDQARTEWHSRFGFPSIGVPVPHAVVSILGPNGHELREGERGEIAVRGGMVMKKYAGRDGLGGQRWLMTGDEGFWRRGNDGEKYFFITGRMKEIIIRGGANISPVEIDAVIRTHPAVRFGLAIPFPNRFYGEEVAVYVVRDSPVSEEAVLAHCADYLDFARCPKVVVFGDDVPYTSTGKAKRIELAQRLEPHLAAYRDVQFSRSAQRTQTEV